jgi:serine/threonine-protein kinase
MLLEVGQTYAGRYRIARKLGEGAMGAVYEAEHILIHRRVALKVLLPTVAERGGALHRFEREAQAAGRIGSPHIVEVLDMGDLAAPDGSGTARFIVMELLEGETLQQRLDVLGRLTPVEIATIACQVLAGLGAAHAADIVHRDLKPANVFLVRGRAGDFVKILDFGVSKFASLGEDMHQTAPGATLGTPYYMSPEQAKGSPRIDHRSDLYSVGVMLYETVTGQVPFDAGTFNELIFRIVLESPPPFESFVPDADPDFVAIVKKAMAREPDERYQTAREMHDALSQWLTRQTGRAVAPGVVPWDAAQPFVPETTTATARRVTGPSTEIGFDHAATLLHVPRAKRPFGAIAAGGALLGVIVAGSILFLPRTDAGRTRPAASTPAASASPPASSAPPVAPPLATASAAPPPVPAPPHSAAPPVAAKVPASSKKATPAAPQAPAPAPVPGPAQRTVPSEL